MVSSKVGHWSSLPLEIRDMILEVLTSHESLSCYASVSREWQQAMERTTFRQIRMTPSRLSGLTEITYPRRGFLECINFYIAVQEYDCSLCDELTEQSWSDADDEIVATALRDLFCSLSTWEPTDRHLTLDISISSPSDAQHYFKHDYFDDAPSLVTHTCVMNDARHGWTNGELDVCLNGPLDRVFKEVILCPIAWRWFPTVRAITGLRIRRQSRRQLQPDSLGRLLDFLPRLQTICYEPWRKWTRFEQWNADDDNLILLSTIRYSRGIKRLTIFEDFDDEYAGIACVFGSSCYTVQPECRRIPERSVGGALARVSRGLESLSASFIVDAKDFFTECRSSWVWQNLTSLALTSRTLYPRGDGDCVRVNHLFQQAADFVLKSPKLTTLVLWNYSCKSLWDYHGSATGAFICQVGHGERRVKIMWRGTWCPQLDQETIRSWKAVATKHDIPYVRWDRERLDGIAAIWSRGDAIRSLRLPVEVIDARSLNQIVGEAKSPLQA